MKAQDIAVIKDKAAGNNVEVKPFPGKPLDATVFKEKFDEANEVGRKIKGFKERNKHSSALPKEYRD